MVRLVVTTNCRYDATILKLHYKLFDANCDGEVDLEEWVVGVAELEQSTLHERLTVMFEAYDTNGDRHLDMTELVHFCSRTATGLYDSVQMAEQVWPMAKPSCRPVAAVNGCWAGDGTQQVMAILDDNNSGRVSMTEFQEVCSPLQPELAIPLP